MSKQTNRKDILDVAAFVVAEKNKPAMRMEAFSSEENAQSYADTCNQKAKELGINARYEVVSQNS